jgi:hypothetical protein
LPAAFLSGSPSIPTQSFESRGQIVQSRNLVESSGERGPSRAIDALRFYEVDCGMRRRLVTPKT